MQLLNYMQSVTVHNVLAHQPQWVAPASWFTSVKWYPRGKLARIKILQNFWFTLVLLFDEALSTIVNKGNRMIKRQWSAFQQFSELWRKQDEEE